MKKSLYLTSLLILAACGGSGGGTNTTRREVLHIGTVSHAAAQSNARITTMVSEIGVADDDTMINPGRIIRAGSFEYNGKHYDSYKLDNVDMQISDWVEDGVTYTFSIDENGKITGIERVGGSNPRVMARQTDTEFDFVFGNGEDTKTKRWTLTSFANKVGLRYSDISELTGPGPWSTNDSDAVTNVIMPVIMGYKVKKIDDTSDLGTERIVFRGVAAGTVADHYTKPGAEEGHDYGQLAIEDRKAKLVFDNGAEELTASFDNWYDVKVTKDTNNKITFEYTNEDARAIDEQFQFKTASATADLANSGFMGASGEQAHWTTNYYGKGTEPKESTAMFHYVQPYTASGKDDAHTDVVFGFGGLEQK